jgi:hypothetical protein
MPRYRSNLQRSKMNNGDMTYDDYLDWDREYRLYEWYMYIKEKYVDSIDRDDMDYPPAEYWDSGL